MKLHHGSSFFVVKKDIFKSLPTYHPFFNFSKRGLSIIKHRPAIAGLSTSTKNKNNEGLDLKTGLYPSKKPMTTGL